MCGIFGFSLIRDLTASDVDIGFQQLDLLSHRGPDGQGHAAFHEQGVFIGHVIDLRLLIMVRFTILSSCAKF